MIDIQSIYHLKVFQGMVSSLDFFLNSKSLIVDPFLPPGGPPGLFVKIGSCQNFSFIDIRLPANIRKIGEWEVFLKSKTHFYPLPESFKPPGSKTRFFPDMRSSLNDR